MRPLFAVVFATALGATACAPAAPARTPPIVLPGNDGARHDLGAIAKNARLTVVSFFSSTCGCQRAHDARLRELSRRYGARGVAFVAIDAEATATLARDAAEARARSYPYPLLTDPSGKSADALGASYSTYTVVLDPSLAVRYRGGIDSDMHELHDDAQLYLADALDALLAGREPTRAKTEALGCSLRRW
jgi:hypothetical protein